MQHENWTCWDGNELLEWRIVGTVMSLAPCDFKLWSLQQEIGCDWPVTVIKIINKNVFGCNVLNCFNATFLFLVYTETISAHAFLIVT